eukprot:m51a1_g397 putative calcium-binding protein (189) ;mRNA; f:709736-710669
MGQGQSEVSLGKEQLVHLQHSTHFDVKELNAMYRKFRTDTPQGVLSRAEFVGIIAQMGVHDEFLQGVVFSVFDSNKDGFISFMEFATALSVMIRGTPDEKLEFAFQMYDLDGNGYISRDEMMQIMAGFYRLVGPLVTFSGKKYDSPKQVVDELFERMDTDKDGQLSLSEYKEGALKNPDIIQGLRLFM